MRRTLVHGCATELVDALRSELTRLVPGNEHDESVACHRRQGAVQLLVSIDGTVGIRAAVDGQINRPATQAVHLAPLRIETSEVRLQRLDGLAPSRSEERRVGEE